MQKDQQSYRQEVFIQLAFTMYGYLVTPDVKKNSCIVNSMGFVADHSGLFYLINNNYSKQLEAIDYTKEASFAVLKEGASVLDMFDIRVKGNIVKVEANDSKIADIGKLFADKSPYFSHMAFKDDKLMSDFTLIELNPTIISFINFQDAREGYEPIYLEKE